MSTIQEAFKGNVKRLATQLQIPVDVAAGNITLKQLTAFYNAAIAQQSVQPVVNICGLTAIESLRIAIIEILDTGEKLPPKTRELVYSIKNITGEILADYHPVTSVKDNG